MNELVKIENGAALLDLKTAERIAFFEEQVKVIKEQEDELKAAILAEMEMKGIVKLDNEYLTITYIAPTDRETLNSKELKAELPDIYNAYTDIKPVKSSIRIKVK